MSHRPLFASEGLVIRVSVHFLSMQRELVQTQQEIAASVHEVSVYPKTYIMGSVPALAEAATPRVVP